MTSMFIVLSSKGNVLCFANLGTLWEMGQVSSFFKGMIFSCLAEYEMDVVAQSPFVFLKRGYGCLALDSADGSAFHLL